MLSFLSCTWCQGLAVTCACGTPWTFLLIIFRVVIRTTNIGICKRIIVDACILTAVYMSTATSIYTRGFIIISLNN